MMKKQYFHEELKYHENGKKQAQVKLDTEYIAAHTETDIRSNSS